CIAGILSADNGMIRVDGRDVTALDESARDTLRAQKLGYIFQTFNLLQGFTCLENVCLGMMFGSGLDKKKAAALLGEVGLGNYLQHRPSQLSVGQQQRVAIARALANHPKLVLADEPTGNLDPELAQDAMQLIRRLCDESGAALLLVSHDTELLGQFEHCRDLKDINTPQKETEA
ncbi:MAG: ATP-binding cassette domain-containing protein, partial [Verrucomicrobiota bacterium]|nr:ATP-binding cassette domain-containing protein [Verrucomicrobiota bacterium]